MTRCRWCKRTMPYQGKRGNACCSRPCAQHLITAKMHARNARIDEMAVERLVSGHPVRASKAERLIAVDILTRRGESARQIAAALRIAQRSVNRLRAEIANKRKAA